MLHPMVRWELLSRRHIVCNSLHVHRMRIDQFAGQSNEWQEGIIFVLAKTGEEKNTAHTLYPAPSFTDLQPQFIGVIDTLDPGQAIRNLPMR